MQLKTWIKKIGGMGVASKHLGVTRRALRNWVLRHHMPNRSNLNLLLKKSNGKINISQFL